MADFDFSSLLGPLGGQLAIAFGAGCAAGYAFCIRTVYKMLDRHSEKQLTKCEQRIEELEDRTRVLEDRLYSGSVREIVQMRESSVRVLGAEKLGRVTTIVEDEE